MQVRFSKNLPQAQEPSRATVGSAGYDLTAAAIVYNEQLKLIEIDTGLSTEFSPDHVMLIFCRSGLSKKFGLHLANGVGVVDSDYRGPLKVMLRTELDNMSEIMAQLNVGDRVAQAIFMPITAVQFVHAGLSDTARGEGGFGSTGT